MSDSSKDTELEIKKDGFKTKNPAELFASLFELGSVRRKIKSENELEAIKNIIEIRKQENILKTLEIASSDIKNGKTYDEFQNMINQDRDSGSEDKIFKILNSSSEVSEEEFQLLWAKLLAREIEKPKSVRNNILEFVKKLDKDIIDIIYKYFKLSCVVDNHMFLASNEKVSYVEEPNTIPINDYELLVEYGILTKLGNPPRLTMPLKMQINNILFNGLKYRIITNGIANIQVHYPFTKLGYDLYLLIGRDIECDLHEMHKIVSQFLGFSYDNICITKALSQNKIVATNEVVISPKIYDKEYSFEEFLQIKKWEHWVSLFNEFRKSQQ